MLVVNTKKAFQNKAITKIQIRKRSNTYSRPSIEKTAFLFSFNAFLHISREKKGVISLNKFKIISLVMGCIAVAFLTIAFTHPEMSIGFISADVPGLLYSIYLCVLCVFIILACKKGNDK